jgi:hypothetical protein
MRPVVLVVVGIVVLDAVGFDEVVESLPGPLGELRRDCG